MNGIAHVGINGFGRIGRLALRAGWGRDDLEFVDVNEVKGGPQTGAHLLEFDSVHGRWHEALSSDEAALIVDGRRLTWSDVTDPAAVHWSCSGCGHRARVLGRIPVGSDDTTDSSSGELGRSW